MAISWGMQERYKFSSYGTLTSWVPPVLAGVYAITYRRDAHNNPKKYTVLYFGEAEDLSRQDSDWHRNVVRMFTEDGGTTDELFVFVHPMLGSTQYERARIQQRLIAEYQPHGNEPYSPVM